MSINPNSASMFHRQSFSIGITRTLAVLLPLGVFIAIAFESARAGWNWAANQSVTTGIGIPVMTFSNGGGVDVPESPELAEVAEFDFFDWSLPGDSVEYLNTYQTVKSETGVLINNPANTLYATEWESGWSDELELQAVNSHPPRENDVRVVFLGETIFVQACFDIAVPATSSAGTLDFDLYYKFMHDPVLAVQRVQPWSESEAADVLLILKETTLSDPPADPNGNLLEVLTPNSPENVASYDYPIAGPNGSDVRGWHGVLSDEIGAYHAKFAENMFLCPGQGGWEVRRHVKFRLYEIEE